jgi:two-component system sensor histidine kinase RpfC
MAIKVAHYEPFDLYDVIRRVVSICKPGAQDKGLQFLLYVDPDVPALCRGSEQHIQEILINTLGNAVKYTEKGSVQLKVTVASRDPQGANCSLMFEVIDTGIGISPQLMPRIFEPFTLGDDSASRKHSGTGLGLTITKQYVEQMGGSVRLSSKEGLGTTCVLKLPLDELDDSMHALPEGRASCLLVSDSYLTDRDISFFDSALCSVHQTNPQKLATASALGKYDIYLIDCAINSSFPLGVVSQLAELTASSLVVAYVSDAPNGVAASNSFFMSKLRAGAIGDLISIRRLHRSLFNREEASPLPSGASLRLLIADDNPVNLKTAEMSLASAGHSIDLARDGDEALDLLEQGDYDLAILDMHMPGMSGLDVARFYNFMSRDNPTPIMLLTADATADARNDSAGAGIRDVLTKPMRARDLRAAVAKYARRPNSTDSSRPRELNETVIRIDEAIVRSTELEELIDLGTSLADVASIIDEFHTDTIGIFHDAIEAARHKKGGTVKELMHSLKGSAATLGAVVLQKRARRIEQCTSSEACTSLLQEEEEMKNLLERTVQGMRRVLADAQRQIRKGA